MKLRRRLILVWIVLLIAPSLATGCHGLAQEIRSETRIPNQARLEDVQSAPQLVTLFSDNFNELGGDWNLDSNWTIYEEVGNPVLDGNGHAWATLIGGENWSDYNFSVDVKMMTGTLQIMFRMTDTRGRYIVGMHPGGLYLRREYPWENISNDLATYSGGFLSNNWYTLRVEAELGNIKVFVDGVQRMSFKDYFGATLWQGNIGLEVTGGPTAHARFDNVLVTGVQSPEFAWYKTGGPIGGLGYDVRFGSDLNILYVTDNYSGVNKSQDGGENWFITNRGIEGRAGSSGDAVSVFTLTVDPNNADIIWAGLKDVKGLYKSSNGGQTWDKLTPDITDAEFVFRGVTIQPGNSNIVYAQGEIPSGKGKANDKAKGRIYRSEDGGLSWETIWEGNNLVRYVIIHPENPDVLYASLGIFDREADDSDCYQTPPDQGTGGVLKLAKHGTGWDVWYLDSAHGLTDHYVGSLVMHPEDPQIMLAGAGNVSCSRYYQGGVWYNTGGVFLTLNGGEDWVQTLENEVITSVEFAPSNPHIAIAGGQLHVYLSTNGGESWDMVAGENYPWGPPGVQAGFPIDFLFQPDDPNVIFANNYGGGNVMSKDGGRHWELASQGYTGALMLGVANDPNHPATVYGVARSGAFRSLDGGKSWIGLSLPPAQLSTAYDVAVKPDEPNVVLVSQELLGHVYRSEDSGISWTDVFTLTDIIPGVYTSEFGVKRFAFAPSNNQIVYGGSCRGSVPLDAGNKDGKGIWKSVDGGQSWNEANDGKTEDLCVTDIAVDPNYPNTVYAATPEDGLYRTTDGGNSWTLLPGLPTDMRAVAVHPENSNIVFAGSGLQGMYRSLNAGQGVSATWTRLVDGMEPNDTIRAVVFDPANPQVVWVASWWTGVYRWIPGEARWTHVNDGLRTRAVMDLSISNDGKVLYAATTGEGVFRLGDISWETFLPLVVR
jgi:photosystem II stability/assembly factor-like uncharacterized protein